MGKRTDIEIERDYKRWKELLCQYDFRNLPFVKQAVEIGVSPTTISKWHKALTPNQWKKIDEMTLEILAPQSVIVNDALFKAAASGDVAAIKLFKQTREGWTERTAMEMSRGRDKELDALANDDLVKMLIKDWPLDKKLSILSGGAGVLPLPNDASNSVDPGDSVAPLKPTNEALDRIAEQVRLNEQELREATGGEDGEWGEGVDRSHPKSSSIYERDKG